MDTPDNNANFFQVYTTSDQCAGIKNKFRNVKFSKDKTIQLLPYPTPDQSLENTFTNIPITRTGYYLVNYLASFNRQHVKCCEAKASGCGDSKMVYLGIAVNDVIFPPSTIHMDLVKSNNVETLSNSLLVYLEEGSKISLQFAGDQNIFITSSYHKTGQQAVSASLGLLYVATLPEPPNDPIYPVGPDTPASYEDFINETA